MNKTTNQIRETLTMKQIILSWLPSEENDEHYPNKHAILLTVGSKGYHKTDWLMNRETITKRNEKQGFTDADRLNANCFAMFGVQLWEVTQ